MKKKNKSKKLNKTQRRRKKVSKRKFLKKKKYVKIKKLKRIKKSKKLYERKAYKRPRSFLFKIARLQNSLKFDLKFKVNIFSIIEKSIQNFFAGVEKNIQEYKVIQQEEKRRKKLEEIEIKEKERLEIKHANEEKKKLEIKLKEQHLKDEIKLERERTKDLKLFLRKEQAIVRKEQAEKQRQFLRQIKLEKQIEKFRIREVKELEKLERISLKEQREDYAGLQERIEKLKEKYRIIRDQKIRERVEALGVKVRDGDDRETLLNKEREYYISRQKIELALESFYRSANSLVFQLNRRHLAKNMSLFRCIDRRFENGEIFIKWDESPEEDWLILIYIKDNSPNNEIVIEDKSNPEKNNSYEFKSNEIFKASDLMVDSLTQLLARERSKKAS